MFDVLIVNARILDGTGNPWFYGDIGVKRDKIEAIGDLSGAKGGNGATAAPAAKVTIDAGGLVAAPGFIDIHTHSDLPLMVSGEGHAHIRQGVTTNVIGNCGTSLAPLTDASAAAMRTERGQDFPDIDYGWRTLGQYLDRLEQQGISLNVAALVGHGSVRGAVMGYADRPPTAAELLRMKDLVRGAMEDGAVGLSSGLVYVPGSYAATDEVVELARVAAEYGGIYSTHIRTENNTVLDSVAEAIDIGRQAHLPVEIAHLKAMGRHMWGKSVDILAMLDAARAEGIEVTADQYPFAASATGLGAYLPGWAHVGGAAALRARLRDPAERARMRHDIENGTSMWRGVGWENTMITRAVQEEYEGKMVSEIAKTQGKDPFDAAFDLLESNPGRVSIVFFTIGDEDLERIMAHEAVMVGSDSSCIAVDGPLGRGVPHPRTFGSFVRVLGHYVRDVGNVTLAQAVRKMTSMPARKLGLFDRGLLRSGMKADVVVFDPATVGDRATYTDPKQYATGIVHVFVNGQHTIRNGEHLGTMAGEVLRCGR